MISISFFKKIYSFLCFKSRFLCLFFLICAVFDKNIVFAQNYNFGGTRPNPDQFLNEILYSGLDRPVGLEFSPDGRTFIWGKGGTVWTVKENGQLLEWIDLSERVNSGGDRGLLALALDPNFPETPFVYLMYTEEPNGVYKRGPDDGNAVAQGLIVRYTEVNGEADRNSAFYLLGTPGAWDGIPSCHSSHAAGSLLFGLDGTLIASHGDGARWDIIDWGQDLSPYDPDCRLFGAEQDRGALRSQLLDSLAGKFLRIDKETGNGIGSDFFPNLVSNPWYEFGRPKSIRSRIYAIGVRNPYRVSLRSDSNANGPGSFVFGDVGFATWEEVNVLRNPGENFGWPCRAGPVYEPDHYIMEPIKNFCDSYEFEGPAKDPLVPWHRQRIADGYNIGFGGNCAAGAEVYIGKSYPIQYQGGSNQRALFFMDYGKSWIKVCWIDENDNLIPEMGIQDFDQGNDGMVTIKTNPRTGDLYWVSIHGYIGAYSYRGDVRVEPIVRVSATPEVGLPPLSVQFSSDGTYELDGLPLTFVWDFDDGYVSYLPNPTHTFTERGVFSVVLTVTSSVGLTTRKTLEIRTTSNSPTVAITSPRNNYQFPMEHTPTQFTSQVTSDTPVQYDWEFRLIHNNHFHPKVISSEDPSPVVYLNEENSVIERNSLEVYLTVTDQDGGTATDMIRVRPEVMNGGNVSPNAVIDIVSIDGLTVRVSSIRSNDGDQDLLHVFWDWGDGLQEKDITRTSHTYATPGTYIITLQVEDVFSERGTTTRVVNVQGIPYLINDGQGFAPIYQINCGGSKSGDWEEDQYYNTGDAKTGDSNLEDPYQSFREDEKGGPELRYTIPVSNGNYLVRLYFMETKYKKEKARVFDVLAQGKLVINNLDIFAQAGREKPLIRSFPVTVTDETIDLYFVHNSRTHPIVNAIEIIPT